LLPHGERKTKATSAAPPEWLQQLVLAADQFIVKRALPDEPDGRSVIAGYHWFGDWGRDTTIALPGLTLATGRPEVARQILLAFCQIRSTPGCFRIIFRMPAAGQNTTPRMRPSGISRRRGQYFAETRDMQTLQKLFPVSRGN